MVDDPEEEPTSSLRLHPTVAAAPVIVLRPCREDASDIGGSIRYCRRCRRYSAGSNVVCDRQFALFGRSNTFGSDEKTRIAKSDRGHSRDGPPNRHRPKGLTAYCCPARTIAVLILSYGPNNYSPSNRPYPFVFVVFNRVTCRLLTYCRRLQCKKKFTKSGKKNQ